MEVEEEDEESLYMQTALTSNAADLEFPSSKIGDLGGCWRRTPGAVGWTQAADTAEPLHEHTERSPVACCTCGGDQ